MAGEGLKFDKEKLRYDLLPVECIEEVVKVLTMGSIKYGPNNWQDVEPFEDRYYAALQRHIIEWRKGNVIDSESGLSHLSHAMCNIVFLLWNEKHNKGHKGYDIGMKDCVGIRVENPKGRKDSEYIPGNRHPGDFDCRNTGGIIDKINEINNK
jgi:hypothetical protein